MIIVRGWAKVWLSAKDRVGLGRSSGESALAAPPRPLAILSVLAACFLAPTVFLMLF